jgi:hypothetical protein
MFSSPDPTITGMFLLVAILAALDDYAQRLARLEYRVGLVARQYNLHHAEPPKGGPPVEPYAACATCVPVP